MSAVVNFNSGNVQAQRFLNNAREGRTVEENSGRGTYFYFAQPFAGPDGCVDWLADMEKSLGVAGLRLVNGGMPEPGRAPGAKFVLVVGATGAPLPYPAALERQKSFAAWRVAHVAPWKLVRIADGNEGINFDSYDSSTPASYDMAATRTREALDRDETLLMLDQILAAQPLHLKALDEQRKLVENLPAIVESTREKLKRGESLTERDRILLSEMERTIRNGGMTLNHRGGLVQRYISAILRLGIQGQGNSSAPQGPSP